MKHYRNKPKYPEWRKRVDRLHDKLFPVHSEVVFMDVVGRWWLRWNGFEHQGRIGAWRPDFVSHRKRLVIEVDGNGKIPKNDIIKQMEYFDAVERRDEDLYARGYSVLHWRFTDLRDYPDESRLEIRRWAKNPRKYSRSTERNRRWWQRRGWR